MVVRVVKWPLRGRIVLAVPILYLTLDYFVIKNLENFFEKEYTRQSAGLSLYVSMGSDVFIEADPRLGLGKTVIYALRADLRAY